MQALKTPYLRGVGTPEKGVFFTWEDGRSGGHSRAMNSPLACFKLTLAAGLLACGLSAQTVSTPPADVPLRPVVPADPVRPEPPTYELTLKWNDRGSNVLTVPLKNESDKTLKVLGVQATQGLFLGDFPTELAPGKEDRVSFIYQAAENSDGTHELIRVLTDQGIKEILVKLVREEAVRFSAREVRWQVGEATAAKTVTLTVTTGTVAPQKVRATGGHQAVIEAGEGGVWRCRPRPPGRASLPSSSISIVRCRAQRR